MKKLTKKNMEEISSAMNCLHEAAVRAASPKFCPGCGAKRFELEWFRGRENIEDFYGDGGIIQEVDNYFQVTCNICEWNGVIKPYDACCLPVPVGTNPHVGMTVKDVSIKFEESRIAGKGKK